VAEVRKFPKEAFKKAIKAVQTDTTSEDKLALIFAARNADRLRYDCQVKCWYEWVGTHWKCIVGNKILDEIRDMVRELTENSKSQAQKAARRYTHCRNIEKLVQADQIHGIEVEHDIWDTNPMLLGTPGGTIDLTTGELRPSRPDEYISIVTAVAPAKTANCPMWRKFLDETTAGHERLADYLQVLFGYALIGDNRENHLVFLHGEGGNGKGVFVETMGGLQGDYRVEAAEELLTEVEYAKHSTDIAMLMDARLVTLSETAEDKYWNVVRIKQLTGGNPVTAHKMRQDNITFTPKFLPVVVGNDIPRLRKVNYAIMRRLSLIPFTNEVSEEKKDIELAEKLKAEWPGILRWLIDGCLRWQKGGKLHTLRPPVVKQTTTNYLEGEDVRGNWEKASIVKTGKETDRVSAKDLFIHSWMPWAENAGETAGLRRALTNYLKVNGYKFVEPKGNVVFLGIKCADVEAVKLRQHSFDSEHI
jgi:putative DNA primase/helicase